MTENYLVRLMPKTKQIDMPEPQKNSQSDYSVPLKARDRYGLEMLSGGYAEEYANQIARNARKAGLTVQTIAQDVARLFGGTTTDINYKTPSSIRGKFDRNADEKKLFSEVKDSVRNTIIFDTQKQVDKAVAYMQKHYTKGIAGNRYKKQETDAGYKGNLFNITVKGRDGQNVTAEIQVLTKKMIYAKEHAAKDLLSKADMRKIEAETGQKAGLGHVYYERSRKLKKASAKEKWLKKSRDYYKHFT